MIAGRIERVAGFLILAWGWKRAFLAFAAGALSALAMPPFDLFPVLFLTFPAFVWIMDGVAADPARGWLSRLAGGFSAGWWFGFGFFLAGLWWVGSALLVDGDRFAVFVPLAVLGLPAGLALFWGFAGAVARLLWSDGWRRPLVLAAAFGLAEYLRGVLFTGFPWNAIGHAALTMPLTMQKASVLGLWGTTLLAVAVFAAPAVLAPRIGGRQALPLVVAAMAVAADLGFGAWRLQANPPLFVDGVRLRIVQPAIDQSQKWSPELAEQNFRLLLDLSTAAGPDGAGLPGTALLVWPETAFPFVLTERRDALAALGAMLPEGTVLAAGAFRVEPPSSGTARERAFNSVYTIDDRGEITGAADKVHLVPFGEYLPAEGLLGSIGLAAVARSDGGLEPGARRVLLEGGRAGRFLPLVCYEIIFPTEATAGVERPDFIVNVTNDAWFGYTPGPYQHERQAVLRGVESGLPVVRAANNGISLVADPLGRVVERRPLGLRGAFDSGLPEKATETFFARNGSAVFFTLLAFFFAIAAIPRRKR